MWRVGGTGFDETAVFMKKLCGDVAIRAEGRWEGKREGKAFERSFGMGGGRATRGWTALSGLAISLGSIKQRKSSSVRRKGGKRPTRGGADQPVAKRREETLVACVHEDDPLLSAVGLKRRWEEVRASLHHGGKRRVRLSFGSAPQHVGAIHRSLCGESGWAAGNPATAACG